LKDIVGRLSVSVASVGIYLPVIAGIITPMLWLLPAWYAAWSVIGFIFPFSSIWGGIWAPVDNIAIASLIVLIEIVIFLSGLALFTWALFVMIRDRLNGVQLITTGPYQWIRHPQHLGIIVFLLPLALYNPSVSLVWSGIRPGDILSWSLVAFMLVIIADIEEIKLTKLFEQEYENYCAKTPFILPKVALFKLENKSSTLRRGKPLRYFLLFSIYWGTMSLVLFLFTFGELAWTR
jgi:protein-S-isoprenylcysteine O-methyltransferase Ste14